MNPTARRIHTCVDTCDPPPTGGGNPAECPPAAQCGFETNVGARPWSPPVVPAGFRRTAPAGLPQHRRPRWSATAGGCSYSATPATPLDSLIAAQGDHGAQSPCSNPSVLLKSNLAHAEVPPRSCSGSALRRTRDPNWRTVRGLRAILGALAAAVGAVLVILVGAAAAAGPQASRDEVFHALGVDEINADYVIAVDTSASMQDGDLYGQVTGALRPLLQALPPADHLSLLTFDTVPALRYSGPVGSPGDRALAQLPPRATGANTDLGNAISAAMRELQRPDAARIQTLILITDGKQDAPPGSAYPATSGPGWEQLATRAQALPAVHPIASYALAVRPETDAAVLAQVMPETQVLNLPGDQVAGFFDRVKSDTRAAKARAVLRPDLSQPVQVSWRPADLAGLDLRRGTATTVVSLSSTTTRVPLTLSSLAVRSRGVDVQAVGLPDTLTLAPGATTALPLTLRFHQRGGFGWGQRSVTETGQLEVTGSFGSPWRAVVTDDLGLPFEPKLAGATVATRARGT